MRGDADFGSAWGLTEGYRDAEGVWHATTPEARAALLAAMRVEPDAPLPPPAPVRVVRAGEPVTLPHPADLELEEGGTLRAETALPPDLPLGYHALRPLAGGPAERLIVAPARCALPQGLRAWGWAVQPYALRSAESWGMGDLADLSRVARWSARELGAGLLLLNPLDAVLPILPQQASPYSPSSRRFLNPLYLRVEEVPGAREAGVELEPLARAGRDLHRERHLDRDVVFRLKTAALGRLWSRWTGGPAFDRYCAERGEALRDYAIFCVLAEHFGAGWPAWPAEYRHPTSPAVSAWAATVESRVRFHAWVQWLLDRQLAEAGAAIRLVRDLPVGVQPDGADAWAWQDILARNTNIGAPPDAFNPGGQDWGLPPFVPHRLRAAGYAPFIETLRAAFRHAGALRIDHVMGLFRLFWVLNGVGPRGGAYVHYPAEDLLAIVALESQRAGAVVVGEDLGTVEDAVRAALAQRDVLSYRLLWFEPAPPRCYPVRALAAVTTHDLPTIAGVWTGADLDDQRAAGLAPDEGALHALRERLRVLTGVSPDASVPDVVVAAHRRLAEAPSALVAATLEDALGVPDRPNLPGTTIERPNWLLALPEPLEAIEGHPLVRAVAKTLVGGGDLGRAPAGARPDPGA